MLGKVVDLNFMDYDITDAQNFPELAREKYLCTKRVSGTSAILMETQLWEIRLEKPGILKMFEIPHFRHSLEINACIKVLLSYIHGGTLWLDPPVSIDIVLIAWITRLLKEGEDLSLLFHKVGERSL
jgi:hypothetical protein